MAIGLHYGKKYAGCQYYTAVYNVDFFRNRPIAITSLICLSVSNTKFVITIANLNLIVTVYCCCKYILNDFVYQVRMANLQGERSSCLICIKSDVLCALRKCSPIKRSKIICFSLHFLNP